MKKKLKPRQWVIVGRASDDTEFLDEIFKTRKKAREIVKSLREKLGGDWYIVRPVTIGDKVCKWREDDDGWMTACGDYRLKIDHFCSNCGGKIKVIK